MTRIRDLALEAVVEMGQSGNKRALATVETFLERVVREAADVADDLYIASCEYDEDVATAIHQHFGLE